MPPSEAGPLHIVTGAYSYTGRYITRCLLERGVRVSTLTGHPDRPHEFGARVPAFPLDFSSIETLVHHLQGADTLYNTYWVRFNHGEKTYTRAVENTRRLLEAARLAGVRRIVHISITNPALDSPLPYFRGKALLERDIQESGLSYAILRPTVVFSKEGILLNNIAYLLRRFPVFAIPGDGRYRLQPVHVEDLARLAVEAGLSQENLIVDAVGPETYTFTGLVQLIARATGSRSLLIHLPPGMVFALARLLGGMLGDVLLTRDEIDGLMQGLLVSNEPPLGRTRLSTWLGQHGMELGRRYASELERHYLQTAPVNSR
ncbi:MAG: NAD(P)H-binding protein [Chloroflexi bacterium]|jgi:uncharacterized protein YbjT (DUF2867 family)|nr:NAD(P)H-binding protein [Chloroflexota bacterium]